MNQLFTPCIIQTIVICCTIIIASLVGLSLYRIHKKVEQSWQGYVFISCILVILAVIIFSFAFYGDRDVLDFISLSSALISIILAIITIIYSFYSNSRSVGQTEKLQNAAETVQKATISYSDSAASLQENIQKIVAAVSRVEAKTDRLLETNQGTTHDSTNVSSIFSDFDLHQYVDRYIRLASKLGVVALYACILSRDKQKSFPTSLLNINQNGMYVYGFLVATVSAGLIVIDIDFKDNSIKANEYIPLLKEITVKKIQELKVDSGVADFIHGIDEFFKE